MLSQDGEHDVVLLRRDPRRVTAPTRPAPERPSLAFQALPPTNGRLADPEQRRRLLVRHPLAVERSDDTLPKIDRVRPPHRHLPSKPEGQQIKDVRSRQLGSAVTPRELVQVAGLEHSLRSPSPHDREHRSTRSVVATRFDSSAFNSGKSGDRTA